MSISQAFKRGDLDYRHINITQASEFQNLLFNLTEDNFEDARNASLNFLKNTISAEQFFNTLKNVSTFRPLLVNLCCKLLENVSNELKSIVNQQFQRKLCLMFRTHYHILLTLYENQIITIDNITDHYLFPHESNLDLLRFFYPEIIEKDPQFYSKHVQSDEIEAFLSENMRKTEEFKEKRKKKINENQICQFISMDDFESFTNYIKTNSIDLNSTVPFSLFESTNYVFTFSEDGMNFIEYAAFFGSFKILQFLLQNKTVFINSNLLNAAAIGGNKDIIHLLEERKAILNIDTFYEAVNSHQNEIANYIIENNKTVKITAELLNDIIPSYNLEFIKKVAELLVTDEFAKKEEKNFLNSSLFIAIECNFSEVVEFLVSYRKFLNINYKYENFYNMTLLLKAALSHQIENIKILLNQKGIDTSLADSKILKNFFFHGISFYFFF